MERRRREWGEQVRRMDAERLVKISWDNIPAKRRSTGRQKRRWSYLIPDLKQGESPTTKNKNQTNEGSK